MSNTDNDGGDGDGDGDDKDDEDGNGDDMYVFKCLETNMQSQQQNRTM